MVISCLSAGLVKTLNQKRMENSDDTVLASLETSMVANWSSSFRPHGAYVDELRFTIFEKGETAQALLALDRGNIDAFDGQIPLNSLPPMLPDYEISWFPSTTYKQLILNSGRFPTNITAFRRAIAFSYDKGQANVHCTGGTGKIQDSYIPRTVTEWEVESQLPEHFYEQDVVSGNNSLINAGFIDLDGDGWREYDKNHNSIWDPGVDLDDEDPSIVIDLGATAGNDPDFYVCRTAQDGLTQMGIHSNIVIKDYDTLLADAANGTFWAFCFNTVVDPTNPPAFLYSYFRSNSAANLFWFSNSTIDATLAEMVTAPSLDEVKEIAAEATILLTFEQPAIVCYNEAHINAYRTDIFTGFFEFKGNGYTGRNPYCATKVHLKDSLCPLGGTFKMSMLGDLETTNIHSVSEVSTDMVMGYIYEKLWQIDPLTWDPIPGLAYDWDIESTTANGDIRDGQKFTFYLYNNETWHDGEAFTAVDVNHSIHMSRISSNGRSELWDIYKIEIPDDYTIELYVNKTGYMEWTETTSFYVTPEH
ncbi:MAG: ABC transporter substrate-binding protein, partial [Promethearchaeota archaeon]